MKKAGKGKSNNYNIGKKLFILDYFIHTHTNPDTLSIYEDVIKPYHHSLLHY